MPEVCAAHHRAGAGSRRRSHRVRSWSSRSLTFQKLVHSVTERLPLDAKRVESQPPVLGQPVVAPWRSLWGLLPKRLDKALPTNAREERVHGPLARDEAVGLGEPSFQLEPVHVVVFEQR